jgi:hypothetical protein
VAAASCGLNPFRTVTLYLSGVAVARGGVRWGRVQDPQAPLDVFVGRAAELTRVAEVITQVEAGQPGLVAIEGDPGLA